MSGLHTSEDTHWCQGYIHQRTLTSVRATYIRGHSLVSGLHISEDTHWCQGYIHQRTLTGVRATYIRGHSLVSGLHTSEDTHWCQGYIHQRTLTSVSATYIRGHSLVSRLHTSEDTHWCYGNCFHISNSSWTTKDSNISREGRFQSRLACLSFQTLYQCLVLQNIMKYDMICRVTIQQH